jgi:hypothetical protein
MANGNRYVVSINILGIAPTKRISLFLFLQSLVIEYISFLTPMLSKAAVIILSVVEDMAVVFNDLLFLN